MLFAFRLFQSFQVNLAIEHSQTNYVDHIDIYKVPTAEQFLFCLVHLLIKEKFCNQSLKKQMLEHLR